ncbi:MAG: two-component sensor histidine kinase [Desulfuromonas sp.]|nr:MAG: two-component sensor histidine kinase [Desulfuromonas sp.]
MRQRLLIKLLLVNVFPVIGVIIIVVWVSFDQLAADYFTVLMEKYDVSPTETHQMFLTAVHRYLVWAAVISLGLALLLSYLLTRRILRPLSQMASITRDVSAGQFHRRVEISSQDEVGQLGLDFNRMADSLARLEQLRKTMVADVAHELRTPLTNLRGYFEAMSDDVIPPTRGTLNMLQQEILHLVKLVERLQQLAKADAAKAFLDQRPADLVLLIKQMVDLFRPNLDNKRLEVDLDLRTDECWVKVDVEKVLQVIRNLLENACKYTPEAGRIRISLEPGKERAVVAVTNYGPGIKGKDLPYIFERFFRGDPSRRRVETEGGGAGIGLSIVKELVEAHGGEVGATSEKGETRVWFSLPREPQPNKEN